MHRQYEPVYCRRDVDLSNRDIARQVWECFNVDNLAEKFGAGRLSDRETNSHERVNEPNGCPSQGEKHYIGLERMQWR